MQLIDLKDREVFGDQGRGVAVLVDEPQLGIRQIGLEPGREIPPHRTDGPVVVQVVRGAGLFRAGEESLRMAPGRLLRVSGGTPLEVFNDTAEPLVFLLIGTPEPPRQKTPLDRTGSFFNFVDFAPLKPGKEEPFLEWFRRSSEVFAGHRGFISRRLLRSIEPGGGFASVVEHESKETFMDMHLSDDREELFRQVEPMIMGDSKPRFFETVLFSGKK